MYLWGLSGESTDTERLRREYIVLSTDPTKRIINVQDVKDHLKLNIYNYQGDTFYEGLIDAATGLAEHYMRREVVEKKIRTYINAIGTDGLEIRRASLLAIDSFSYLDDSNVWQTIDTDNYYFTEASYYSVIYPSGNDFPDIRTDRKNPARVDMTVGWRGEVPKDIKLAILNHIAVLNEQRGDWGSADVGVSKMIQTIPSVAKGVYGKYRIQNR